MKYLLMIFVLLAVSFNYNQEEIVTIPDQAIRLRIIANSSNPRDQYLKQTVKDGITSELTTLLKDSNSLFLARKTISGNIPKIEQTVQQLLQKENSIQKYKVVYGQNYFPAKKFNGIDIAAGNYESLVIKLGYGQGDNWWCILFPPLCLMEVKENDHVEYKLYIKELVNKYL